MAGIYLHIPFCRQACSYCDFHFSTLQKNRPELVRALQQEIKLQQHFFPGNTSVKTVYFGGGSPSILTEEELEAIVTTLNGVFPIQALEEFTLEANPDDITNEKLHSWKRAGINRLSIGIQSFREVDLRLLNRAHSSDQAYHSVLAAKEAGFENITIDLMYGLPGLSLEAWESNLEKALSLGVPHISMYALSVEEKTKLAHQVKTAKIQIPGDELYLSQFFLMAEQLAKYGFEQYEISNFAQPGFRARHNSAYWKGKPYLGLGPSAHSFLKGVRSWNVSSNSKYIDLLNLGKLPTGQSETLTKFQVINEFFMTRLRLSEGFFWAEFSNLSGTDLRETHQEQIAALVNAGEAETDDLGIRLTLTGKIVSDRIIRDLFFEE